MKALFHNYILQQRDNNNIYIIDGYAAKLEYPMNQTSLDYATRIFQKVYDKYLKDSGGNIYFSVGLSPKGAAKILAWEAAIVALRPILLTIVVNIPLMALMLDAGGITAADFIAKRLPLVPAILLFVAVIAFFALAYFLGGKQICNMNLAETIKDDTLSM